MSLDNAWFESDRLSFLSEPTDQVVGQLSSSATRQGWFIEPQQHEEWQSSVQSLQRELAVAEERPPDHSVQYPVLDPVAVLRSALSNADLEAFRDVILEYNMRRRGLRIDCVLLGCGIIAVIEFKRTRLTAADRDQVTNYCINLLEFHEETQRAVSGGAVIVPILVSTGTATDLLATQTFHASPWESIVKAPFECSAPDLAGLLRTALQLRQSAEPILRRSWLTSRFSPSSTILDAAISLYGEHTVSAIREHAAPIEILEDCTASALEETQDALQSGKRRIILVSGAPGAGKTLVGLKLAFSRELREKAVFVTGNAPLVEVLTEALTASYRKHGSKTHISGYSKQQAHSLVANATFKIVKVHNYLGHHRQATDSADERVVIFDEAQRTYKKGKTVQSQKLTDHEADLVLESLENAFEDGSVVVALLGHNQAINTGEQGGVAWMEAATRRGWEFSISDDTLDLDEFADHTQYRSSPLRRHLRTGHLHHSLRFYRNAGIEQWAHAVLENDEIGASAFARDLDTQGHTVCLTRSLDDARLWARRQRAGEERIGLIASAQGRRLAACGIHVELKPRIGPWMLTPSGDTRSSNMLETAQNQYQIQGLELDYTVVCWDADLRRDKSGWASFKVSGGKWQKSKAVDIAKNGYRVLLTRARKGMIIFVPRGGEEDPTRSPPFYDAIAEFLQRCGARPLS